MVVVVIIANMLVVMIIIMIIMMIVVTVVIIVMIAMIIMKMMIIRSCRPRRCPVRRRGGSTKQNHTIIRPVHLLRVFLLRVLESNFPGDSL